LILRKISKIPAYSAPPGPLAVFKGLLLRGGKGRGREGKGREREGTVEEGKGGEGCPPIGESGFASGMSVVGANV